MQLYHPKTTAGALGGALSVIFIMELSRHGVPIDAAEGGAITLLLGWLCGYIAPDSDVTQADVEAGINPPPQKIPPVRTVRAGTPAGPAVQAMIDELDIPPRPKPAQADPLSEALLRPGASGRLTS